MTNPVHPDQPYTPSTSDEKALWNAVMNVICSASSYPDAVATHVLGRDMAPLGNKLQAAILPLIASVRRESYDKGHYDANREWQRAGDGRGLV